MKSPATTLTFFVSLWFAHASLAEAPAAGSALAAETARIQEDAKTGNERAMALLGELHRANLIATDRDETIKSTRAAAEKGNPLGRIVLAQFYFTGYGMEKDQEKGRVLAMQGADGLHALAEKGDVWAQFELGLVTTAGLGVDRKPEEAVKWFQKAADQGFAPAQAAFGRCLLSGFGVAKDVDAGFPWVKKSAEQGFPEALLMLGHLYMNGIGVAKSASEALSCYRKASESGYPDAQYVLATCCAAGRGTNKDMGEAFKWYLQAAERGHVDSQANVGLFYKMGYGTRQNPREALRWLRTAAMHGAVPAQVTLGFTYMRGEGPARDLDEARRWFFMAANSTNPRYRKHVQVAAKAMERLSKPGGPVSTLSSGFLSGTAAPSLFPGAATPTISLSGSGTATPAIGLQPEPSPKPDLAITPEHQAGPTERPPKTEPSGGGDTPSGSLNFIAPKLDE